MIKCIFFTCFFCLLVLTIAAQTKSIAYKSHSGSAANFLKAMTTDPLLFNDAGFGLPSHKDYHFIRKVIFLKPGDAVFVSSIYQGDFLTMRDTQFVRDMYDTLRNQPLFYNPHVLDSIKLVLKQRFKFDNSFDEADFIGFDNKVGKIKKEKRKKNKAGMALTPSEDNSTNNEASTAVSEARQNLYVAQGSNLPAIDIRLFLQLAIFSALAGWLSWKLYKSLYRQSALHQQNS